MNMEPGDTDYVDSELEFLDYGPLDENELELDYDEILSSSSSSSSNPFPDHISFLGISRTCLIPVLKDTISQLWPLGVACVFFAIFTQRGLRPKYLHLISTFLGILSLACVIGSWESGLTILVAPFSYWFVSSGAKNRGSRTYFMVILTMGFIYMVLRENIQLPKLMENWSQVRGIQMIIIMKAISISHELTNPPINSPPPDPPTLIEYLGYIFHPGTIVFGPWIPYSLYLRSLKPRESDLSNWSILIVSCPLIALSYLSTSTCLLYWIFSSQNSIWIFAFRDGMIVRFSHYFISSIAQTTCFYSGLRAEKDGSFLHITKPKYIELPRSIVEIVVYWNIPMHTWLKNYVYKPLSPLGPGKSALLTFLGSSMLHGLNFRLSAVLLSLGLYAYIEYSLRSTLARLTSSCISVRACGPNCNTHIHNPNRHLWVKGINFVFSLLAIFHLAYLGIMLDFPMESSNSSKSFDFNYQLSRWRELYFSSHWIAGITYCISLIL